MAEDIDANSQLKKLGSNEIKIGSEFMKFSAVHQLESYDRDEIVIDFIDARQGIRDKINTTHAKMTNKRKAIGNDALLTEPPTKIIKQEEFTSHHKSNEGLQDSEDIPKLICPDVKEEDKGTDGIPELEPKLEPELLVPEDMKTETEEMNTHEEVNSSDDLTEELKSEIKSEEMSCSEMTDSDDEIESLKDKNKPEGGKIEPKEDDFEDIAEGFADDWKTKTEISNEDVCGTEDDFFVPDGAGFENEKLSMSFEEAERLKIKVHDRHRELLKEWQSEDSKAGKKVISNAAWTKTVKIRCTLLDRNQLGCKTVNIIPFKLEFVKECFLFESIFNLGSNICIQIFTKVYININA